jgi:hypothetical protein
MLERNRPIREILPGSGGGLGDPFAGSTGDSPAVTVVVGTHVESLPVANMSIGGVRTRFRDRFDLDPHSQALLDGREVNDDVRIQPGQTLTFIRRAGVKGRQ